MPSIATSSLNYMPVILDPCKKEDCDLLAFQGDGRPVLNPAYADDPIARRRVEDSKVLLNLDHPDFNSKREQLYHDIAEDVNAYEALPVHQPLLGSSSFRRSSVASCATSAAAWSSVT